MSNRWNEVYPRPQLVRDDWLGLNGEWKFRTERPGRSYPPDAAWETINVPFCPESRLSGIERRLEPGEKMIYERSFAVPEEWGDRDVLLHFDAIDQIADVFIDGEHVCHHEGGYLPFSISITDFVRKNTSGIWDSESETGIERKEHVVRVEALDNIDHRYPWGKQKRKNGGMWYTPVSGIWKSVWMEPVPEEHIESLKIDCGTDWVEIRAAGIEEGFITVLGDQYHLLKSEVDGEKSAFIHIDILQPRMWTPDTPYLYDFAIETPSGDRVSSYFALRTLTIENRDGYERLCLNGEPYFFNGLLDQGYWQDGIYTPESPDKFAGDILAMKSLGFNTLRKHIKIEHEQFYYECDRLGMAVFQDMVNNGDYSFLRDTALPTIGKMQRNDSRLHRGESREIFLQSMNETVRCLYNHPSICYWTIFNEGWGQFSADEAYDRLRELDSSRYIDSTSGWFRQNKSDVDSHHVYFKKIDLTAGDKPLVLSEFGGYACKIPGHCYNPDKTYGYRKCENEAALLKDVFRLYTEEVLPLVDKGLCAAIYTQVSDVEDETNGILTYDREILKFRSYSVNTGNKIRAYVAENHSDVIRIIPYNSGQFDVSITDHSGYEEGTAGALVTGILEGLVDLFGQFDGHGNGFDVYILSDIMPANEQGALAAFEILIARIVNDRYFGGMADETELAKIAAFAEREYYGRK